MDNPHMTIDDVLARCPDARKSPDGWRASCPVHGGESGTSLHIWEENGAIKVQCFGGCDFRRVREHFGLNLDPSPAAGRRDEKEYCYHDKDGTHVFSVIRQPPKRFRQCRPSPINGTRIWDMKGVTRCLYHLPRLLAAPPDALVYIVEGEKDVENLESLGLIATTNPGGAKKWESHYSEALRGRAVVILPDNDPPGTEHASLVAHALQGTAARVTIVALPGLTSGQDVSDWLAKGGDAETLAHLVAQAEGAPQEYPDVVVSFADVEPQDIPWLWWPYIALGTLTMLDGNPGQGKSLLTLALATHLSRGLPFPDQQGAMTIPTRQGATLFFSNEDDPATMMKPRLQKLDANTDHVYYFQGTRTPDSPHLRPFTLEDLATLRRCLERLHPLLVVLDPIQAYLGRRVDMSKSNETRALLGPLAELAREFHCAIVCVRHATKGGGVEPVMAMMRGQGGPDMIGAARSGLFVMNHPVDGTLSLLCHSKTNMTALGRTLVFSKDDAHFRWAGVTRLDGEDLAGSGRGPSPRERLRAAFWLEKRLAGGQVWMHNDLIDEAEALEIDKGSLRRGKELLRDVESKRIPNGEGGYTWAWRLPDLTITPPPDYLFSTYSPNTTSSSCSTNATCTPADQHVGRGGDPHTDTQYSYSSTTTSHSYTTCTPSVDISTYEDIPPSHHAGGRSGVDVDVQVDEWCPRGRAAARANIIDDGNSQEVFTLSSTCLAPSTHGEGLCGGALLRIGAHQKCVRCNQVSAIAGHGTEA